MKSFKNSLQLVVLVGIFSFSTLTFAGSYDDFFIAVRNDNASVVSDLLKRGFDPNTVDPKGQPGLTVAMQEHSSRVAKALLGVPATNVNALNQAGESALMMAAIKGDMGNALLLLDRGAQVNQPGWSALHYAATGPEPKLVKLLIERGAKVDAESPNATTPLMMAAQYGSEDNVKILMDAGADVKRRNQKELTAVDFARLSGRVPLVKALEQAAR